MTNEEAYNIISEFCFTGYEDNKKPSFKLFGAIHELILDVEENTKLKAEIERLKENYDTLAKQYSNVENSSIKYYNELKQLKSELKQSVKIPERRRERKTEEYEFGVLGKGFDTGWNSCLDMFESLKGATND